MRARSVNEDMSSVLSPKDPEKIISDFFHHDTMLELDEVLVEQLYKLDERGVITEETMPLIYKEVKQQFGRAWDYAHDITLEHWIEDHKDYIHSNPELNEDMGSILKGKNHKKIIADFFQFEEMHKIHEIVMGQIYQLDRKGLVTKETLSFIMDKIKRQYENAKDWTLNDISTYLDSKNPWDDEENIELDDDIENTILDESLGDFLKPKSKEEVANSFFGSYSEEIIKTLDEVLVEIPPQTFNKDDRGLLERGIRNLLKITTDRFIDVHLDDFIADSQYDDDWEADEVIFESMDDILKPKSKEEIKKIIDEISEFGHKISLKDGRAAWAFEEGIEGMAGESISILVMIDEDGNKIHLNDEGLNQIIIEDRKEIIEWQDELGEANASAAISYVI